MTDERKAELLAEMAKLAKGDFDGDAETGHLTADDLLCTALIEFGFPELVKVFDEVEKWYA